MRNNSEMKKLLFISDLDGTLVYSGYPENVCVEYKGTEEITYMTAAAYTLFEELLEQPGFMFIPCTLRSVEQTSRIAFIKEGKAEWLICDNGFSIYHKGFLDKQWDQQMQETMRLYPNEEVYKKLTSFVRTHSNICRLRDNRFAFFTLIFDRAEIATSYFSKVQAIVANQKYKYDLQGRKLYVLPKLMDKSLAVEYLLHKLPNTRVITAGDSTVDVLFLQRGDVRLIPKHSKLNCSYANITGNERIKAGEEIIKIVYEGFQSFW